MFPSLIAFNGKTNKGEDVVDDSEEDDAESENEEDASESYEDQKFIEAEKKRIAELVSSDSEDSDESDEEGLLYVFLKNV